MNVSYLIKKKLPSLIGADGSSPVFRIGIIITDNPSGGGHYFHFYGLTVRTHLIEKFCVISIGHAQFGSMKMVRTVVNHGYTHPCTQYAKYLYR